MICRPAIVAAACLLTACNHSSSDTANVQPMASGGLDPSARRVADLAKPLPKATPTISVDPDLPAGEGETSNAKAAEPDQTTVEGGTIEDTILVAGKKVDLISNAGSPNVTVDQADYLLKVNNEPTIHEIGASSIKAFGSYILLKLSSGGSACPATYEIVDLTGDIVKETEPFGSCSDLAKAHVAEDGSLIVKTPRFGTAKATVARYRKGLLTVWE